MFLLNSRYPLLCATRRWLPNDRSRLSRSYASNLPSSFGIVLSSALVCSTSPPVSVSGTVYTLELFPGTIQSHGQSDKSGQHFTFVTSSRPRNIDLVPIDYGFRPRLRGRLTLRGLTLRRNPWTFGDRVSHSVCRYSCQHSHFRYLHGPSRDAASPAYGTLRYRSVVSCQSSVFRKTISEGRSQAVQHPRDLRQLRLPSLRLGRRRQSKVGGIAAP